MVRKCVAKVLGEEYNVFVGKREELENKLPEDWDGACYTYDKNIYIVEDFEDVLTQGGKSELIEEVLTHELAHAFIFESGYNVHCNEEDLVVWMAKISRKLVNCVLEVLDLLGEIWQ